MGSQRWALAVRIAERHAAELHGDRAGRQPRPAGVDPRAPGDVPGAERGESAFALDAERRGEQRPQARVPAAPLCIEFTSCGMR